jgi:hypothetical protein
MAGVLGNYEWLANMALDMGVPALGMAFGIPGPVSAFAVSALKKALGMKASASDEALQSKIETVDPDTVKAAFQSATDEVTAKYQYLTRLAEVQADVAKTQISEVNETIRAETAAQAGKPNGWWGQWRTWMAYELTIECPIWGALICWCIVTGKVVELTAATSLLTVWWGARFGVLGIHLWSGSNERQAAITGAPVPGTIANAAAAVKAVVKR